MKRQNLKKHSLEKILNFFKNLERIPKLRSFRELKSSNGFSKPVKPFCAPFFVFLESTQRSILTNIWRLNRLSLSIILSVIHLRDVSLLANCCSLLTLKIPSGNIIAIE